MKLRIGVIGSGPAGASAALFLKKSGHDVVVFEREPQPKPVGAGIMLQPTGMAALDQLGLLEPIHRRGDLVKGVYGETAEGKKVFDFQFQELRSDFYGLGVHRGSLFTTLHDALQAESIPLITDAMVVEVSRNQKGVTIRTAKGYEETFDLAVVANGAGSLLRKYAPKVKRSRIQKQGALWIRVNMPSGYDLQRIEHVYDGTAMMLGVMPIGYASDAPEEEMQVNFFCGAPTSYVRSWGEGVFANWKTKLLQLAPHYEPLVDQIEHPDQVTAVPYHDVFMRPMYDNGIVYIGDAAHATGPHLTSGTNLALLDSWMLSEALEDFRSLDEALVGFSKRRIPQIRFIMDVSRMVTPFFQHERNLSWGRDFWLKRFLKWPISGKIMADTIAGTKNGLFQSLDPKYYTYFRPSSYARSQGYGKEIAEQA